MIPDVIAVVLLGVNGAVLAGMVYNSYRVGRLEGRLENGDFLRCPFYRAKNKGCNDGEGNKSDKKTSRSR